MTIQNIQNSMIRGADGRLYAISASGVTEIADAIAASNRSHIRSGELSGRDVADHEAARNMVTPNL